LNYRKAWPVPTSFPCSNRWENFTFWMPSGTITSYLCTAIHRAEIFPVWFINSCPTDRWKISSYAGKVPIRWIGNIASKFPWGGSWTSVSSHHRR
jgi:hypothetical protein